MTRGAKQPGKRHPDKDQPSKKRKEAGENTAALRKARDFADSLIATAQTIILLLDAEGRISLVNPYFEKLTGYKSDEIVGKDWFSTFLPEEDRDTLRAYYEKVRASGLNEGYVNAILTRTGERRDIEWQGKVLADKQGRMLGFLNTGHDITEHNRIERALKESQERLEKRVSERTMALAVTNEQLRAEIAQRAETERILSEREGLLRSIIDTAVDGIVSITLRGEIETFNPAAERLFGRPQGEMIGRNLADLFVDATPDDDGFPFAPGERRLTARRASGETFPARVSVGEVPPDGHPRFTVFIRDFTERQQTERRLEELRNELQRAARLSAMGEMTSGLAHEINQPLTAIVNYIQACRRLFDNPDEEALRKVHDYMDKTVQQTKRASDIIRHLRQFVEKGEVERQWVTINDVVREAAALALIGAKDAGIISTFRLADDLPPVLADAIQIQQVVFNLVRNAIEALGEETPGEIIIETRAHDDGVEVSVRDNGPGVPAAIAANLFDAFVTTKADGMGIGLSVCRTIVEAHGGRLWLDDNSGGGAVFSFTLPAAQEPLADD